MNTFIKYILILLIGPLLLVSCSNYNKIYNKGTLDERYALANQLYNEGSFKKAKSLYELIQVYTAGKSQAEVVSYRLADSSFKIEDYLTAIHHYEIYLKRYPTSTEIENAQYRIAESYYHLSPKYSVTQTDTHLAINAFQNFIDNNPDSEKVKLANERIKELNFKLEKKAFEIAKQYYTIGRYKSAIVAFDNVILDYLGTSLKEEAMLYKLKSAYELGVNSIESKKEKRVNNAIKIYERYIKLYPESGFISEVNGMYNNLLKLNITPVQKNS